MARKKQTVRLAESQALQKKTEEQAAAAKAAQRMPKTTFKRPQRPNSSGSDEHPAKRAKTAGSDPAASKVEEIEQGSGMMKDLSKVVEGYTKVDLVAAALGENDQAFEEYMKRDSAPELELDNNCENTKFAQVVFAAVRRGHTDTIKSILTDDRIKSLEAPATVLNMDEMVDDEVCIRMDALQYAAVLDRPECARVIIDNGRGQYSSLRTSSQGGQCTHNFTTLHMAAWNSSASTLQVLLERILEGPPSWFQAGDKNHEKYKSTPPEKRKQRGVNWTSSSGYGWQSWCRSDDELTPLHCVLLGLLARGKHRDPSAVQAAHACVKLLLEHGADPNLITGPVSGDVAKGPFTNGSYNEGPLKRWCYLSALHLAVLVESPAIAETLVQAGAVQTPMERETILFLDRKMHNVWNKKLANRDDAALFSGSASVPCRRRWLPIHMVVFNLACIAADRNSRKDENKENVEEEDKFRKLLSILRPRVEACVLPAAHLNSYMTDCLWQWTEDADEVGHYVDSGALFNSTGEKISKFRALQGSSPASDMPLSPWDAAGSQWEHAVADFEKHPAAAKALATVLEVLGQIGPDFVDEEEGLGLVAGAGKGIVMLVAKAAKPLAEAAFSAAFGSAEGSRTETREAFSEIVVPELAAAAQEMHQQGRMDKSLLDGMLREARKKIDSGVAGTPQDWTEVLAFCAGRQVPSGAGSEQRVAVRHFMNSLVYLFAEVLEGSLRPYHYFEDIGLPGFSPLTDLPEEIQFHQWLGRKEAKGSKGSDEDDDEDYPDKKGIWPDMVLASMSNDENLLALLLPKVADEFKKNQEDDEDKKKKISGTAIRKLRLLKDPNLKEYLCDFLFGQFESEDNSLLEDIGLPVDEHGGFFELLALSCASLDKQQRQKKLEVVLAELSGLDEDDGPILLKHLEPMLGGLFDYATSLLMEHGDKAKAEASKGSEHLGNLVLWGDLCQNQALLAKSASQFSLHLEDALKAYEEAIEIASYSSSEAGKQAKFGAVEVLTLLNRESEALAVAATLL